MPSFLVRYQSLVAAEDYAIKTLDLIADFALIVRIPSQNHYSSGPLRPAYSGVTVAQLSELWEVRILQITVALPSNSSNKLRYIIKLLDNAYSSAHRLDLRIPHINALNLLYHMYIHIQLPYVLKIESALDHTTLC